MSSIQTPDAASPTIRYRLPSVHPDGRKFVVIAAVVTLVFAYMAWETLAWPMAGVTLWVAAFFRDPVPRHAAGRRRDRVAGRRAGDDDQAGAGA